MKKHPTDIQRESPILSSNVIFSKSLTRISTRTCQLPSAWQIGPIRIKAKFEQGEDVFRKRRSLFFKKMQIVRGCDVQRNVLVYMVYSDRLIEGSPNSTSTVPIMPWGATDQVQRCADFVEQ
jgi:CreA protein